MVSLRTAACMSENLTDLLGEKLASRTFPKAVLKGPSASDQQSELLVPDRDVSRDSDFMMEVQWCVVYGLDLALFLGSRGLGVDNMAFLNPAQL